jgi:hypothetical protein
MAPHRLTVIAIPFALAAYVVVATLHFRSLPPEIPIQFGMEAAEARTVSDRAFHALISGLAVSLGLFLLLARWALTLPGYDADGRFQRFPQLLPRTLVALDGLGAGGVALITWTGYLCARASRTPDAYLSRSAILTPLALLAALSLFGWLWLRAARRRVT